jgi:hypothetical protein
MHSMIPYGSAKCRCSIKSVTTVRIAHAEPRPGRLANGGFHTRGYLVVLADDAGHRAVPIWMPGAGDVADLLERPPIRS